MSATTMLANATMVGGTGGFRSRLSYVFVDYWDEVSDPRSQHLPIVAAGFVPVLGAALAYVLLCGYLGPALMKSREPFKLRKVMLAYNIGAVIINFYVFVQVLRYLNFGLDIFNFRHPGKASLTAMDIDRTSLAHLYVWTKYYDLFDTVFMVLHKKFNQISGLHLYHHSSITILMWIGLKGYPTCNCIYAFPILNTVVHVIMYSYYALATFPTMRPYLWWKKYLTQLQLVQFVLLIAYTVMFINLQQGYFPGNLAYVIYPQPVIFFLLFWSFYRQSYSGDAKKVA